MNLFFLLSCSLQQETKLGIYNQSPNASILGPTDDSTYDEGQVVEFSAVVDDDFTDPTNLIVSWQSDLQGELPGAIPSQDGNILWSTANLQPGTHVISLMVVDGEGEANQDTVLLNINDLPDVPNIDIIQPLGGDFGYEGEYYTFIADVSDSFESPSDLSIIFSSNVDGDFCNPIADSSGRASCDAILSVNTHELTFTVTNSRDETGAVLAVFHVLAASDIDDDGDGFTENQGDCDDTNSAIYPNAEEVGNGLDDNCDGQIDEGDDDGDGYNESQGDCDDNDPSVSPGAQEVANGDDDNCDGQIDEGTVHWDNDGDGYCSTPPCVNVLSSEVDCNDGDASIYPGAVEVCSDNVDNNCNGSQNEQNAFNCTYYYHDYDGDGYGDANYSSECWCSAGGSDGFFDVTNNSDCYDYNNSAHPNQSSYFSTDRGDGSFDYNCNSSLEKELNVQGSCDGWDASFSDVCRLDTVGWRGSVPTCGATETYLDDDDDCVYAGFLSFSCARSPNGSKTQRCR
jgi:hypothetical protein